MERMAYSPGCRIQSLSSSTVPHCFDLLLRISAIFGPFSVLRTKSELVEVGGGRAALDHHLLRGRDIIVSVLSTNMVHKS